MVACTPGSAGDPVPGNAAQLAGRWDLVVHRPGYEDLLGVVTLAPSDPNDQTVPAALRGGTLEGWFRFSDRGWLPGVPGDSGTSAFIGADSTIVLYLRLEGRCSNCGNLGLAGRLAENQAEGHWTQELSSHPPEGTFSLQRSSSD